MFENIYWGNLNVEYNEFENINKNKPLEEQIDITQDYDFFRAQLDKYIIDVFYNGETEEFSIVLIKNEDWENPFMQRYTSSLNYLEKIMKEFVDFVIL